jgi:antitoxin VapB
MKTAKLFYNGRSQAVRLPKEFRMPGDEVYIERRGDSIVMTPASSDDAWARFHAAVGSAPDFPKDRLQGTHERRKPLP